MSLARYFLVVFSLCFIGANANAGTYPKPEGRLAPLFMECYQPGMVAITFDDGPSKNFPIVLDILAANNVKANFFILGKKMTYDHYVEMASQALAQGHFIENHGWDHTNFMTQSVEQVIKQVDDTNQIIWEKLGVVPRFVRAPHGAIDAKRAVGIWDLDQGIASWNLDPMDYRTDWSSQQMLDMVTAALESSSPATDSFIIDLHDFSDTMVAMLDDMIQIIRANDYAIVDLHECIDKGRQ